MCLWGFGKKMLKIWFGFVSSGNGYNSNGFGPFGPQGLGAPNNFNYPQFGNQFNGPAYNSPGFGMWWIYCELLFLAHRPLVCIGILLNVMFFSGYPNNNNIRPGFNNNFYPNGGGAFPPNYANGPYYPGGCKSKFTHFQTDFCFYLTPISSLILLRDFFKISRNHFFRQTWIQPLWARFFFD